MHITVSLIDFLYTYLHEFYKSMASVVPSGFVFVNLGGIRPIRNSRKGPSSHFSTKAESMYNTSVN